MSDKSIKHAAISDNSLNSRLDYCNNPKFCVKFTGSCLKTDETSFNSTKINLYIVFEIKSWPFYFDNGFKLRNLLGGVKLTENPDLDKYPYSGYGILFDLLEAFSLPNVGFGKDVGIFAAYMISSAHVENKKIYILILGKGPLQGLDTTTLTEEAEYSINFTEAGKKFCLSLHYNGSNSYLFVNSIKMYQLKQMILN